MSVVLVVHREQARLEPCAAAVLDQDFTDLELVAIDDASPDHGPEILDALADRDRRVRVHHLPHRVGAGDARNRALDLAGGDHVWFIDLADEPAPGSLARIDEQLRAASPDVLLVPHSTTDALGKSREAPHRKLLASLAGEGAVTLDRRPALSAVAPGTAGKVFRRAHLRELGVRFGPGAHGELAVTWPALLAAERIAAGRAPGFVHRRSPASDAGGSPFDVFAAYDAVFAFMDARPELPRGRCTLVLPAMLRHQFALLEGVPEADRREFFRRMSQGCARHRTGDEPRPAGRIGRLRWALLEREAFGAFRLLEESRATQQALNRRRAGVSRRRGRRAARKRDEGLQRHYRSRLEQPLDPKLAVYAAYWFRGYACNPRAIYEKARELVPHVRGVWVVNAGAADSIPRGVEYVVAGTPQYYDVIARAGHLINNVNFPNHLVKREGSVHVMTHHGTPLKWMGLDLQSAAVAGRQMDFPALLRRCERWDYSVSSNAFSTLIWERVYPTRYESLEVGYPRNDVLVTATADDAARVRRELGIAPGQTAVLYAPTHREYHGGYRPQLDVARLADALGPDHVLLARLHYFYDADPLLQELQAAGRIRDVASHPSVEELCLAADVLLTDYSSIMFDYAVLDRPIVIHAPDWEVYRAVRGTYFDLMAEPPGTVTRTEPELIEALSWRTAWGEPAASARAAFRTRFCSLEDGGASERVVRRLWLADRETPAVRVTSDVR